MCGNACSLLGRKRKVCRLVWPTFTGCILAVGTGKHRPYDLVARTSGQRLQRGVQVMLQKLDRRLDDLFRNVVPEIGREVHGHSSGGSDEVPNQRTKLRFFQKSTQPIHSSTRFCVLVHSQVKYTSQRCTEARVDRAVAREHDSLVAADGRESACHHMVGAHPAKRLQIRHQQRILEASSLCAVRVEHDPRVHDPFGDTSCPGHDFDNLLRDRE
mmetsp:Transcript_28515/g.92457  ORF Transcript_28515/g.92457 Transcript_28515/m.92457 type:complete len:214 (-) Transcript_28515:256-897(-)